MELRLLEPESLKPEYDDDLVFALEVLETLSSIIANLRREGRES